MNEDKLYVVRLYDGMDGEWMDVSEEVTKEEAESIWNERTCNGTCRTVYYDIDYYEIFPADTKMTFSNGQSLRSANSRISRCKVTDEMIAKIKAERLKLEGTSTYRLWHILWTKAVGTPEYNKDEWKELDGRLFEQGMLNH